MPVTLLLPDVGAKRRSRLCSAGILVGVLALSPPAHADFTIYSEMDATILANTLIRSGISIQTATLLSGTSDNAPTGIYENGPLNIRDGILLTSGDIALALPRSDQPVVDYVTIGVGHINGVIEDPLCIRAMDTTRSAFDSVRLTIDFTLSAGYDGIQVDYIFGSYEFPHYLNSSYADAFGLYVGEPGQDESSYVNFGTDLQGNSININGPFFNSTEVIRNYGTGLPPIAGYNGMTPRLTSAINLEVGKPYRMIMVVCDAGDSALDSGVFLAALAGCKGECEGTTWCGDGVLQSGEACDDGNNVDTDGCRTDCTIQEGWSCTGVPGETSQCANLCGNGVVNPPFEDCEDGSSNNNDDCLNSCRAASCSDGFWHNQGSGTETDVDCGGDVCGPCENDQNCLVDSDCESGYCDPLGGVCTDAPYGQAVDDYARVVDEQDSIFPISAILTNDGPVSGGTFQLEDETTAAGGSVVVIGGDVIYTPPANHATSDSFEYTVCSAFYPAHCTTATVHIAINRLPKFAETEVCVALGVPSASIDVAAYYSDPDNHVLATDSLQVGTATGFSVGFSGTTLELTPGNANQIAQYTVQYRGCDQGTPSACSLGQTVFLYNDGPNLYDRTGEQALTLSSGSTQQWDMSHFLRDLGHLSETNAQTSWTVGASASGPFSSTLETNGFSIAVNVSNVSVTAGESALVGSFYLQVCESCGSTPACTVVRVDVDVRDCLSDIDCEAGWLCDTTLSQCVDCVDDNAAGSIDTGCEVALPACDESGSTPVCVECLADADCGMGNVCQTSTKTCVPCLDTAGPGQLDAGCNTTTPICQQQSGSCHECLVDADCSGGEVCDPTSLTCVGCLDTVAAGSVDHGCSPQAPACDASAESCHGCLADADCPVGDVCDLSVRACVNCLDTAGPGGVDAGCFVGNPACDETTDSCVECLADADCAGSSVCSNQVCVPCLDAGLGIDPGCSTQTPVCHVSDVSTCVTCQDTSLGGIDDGCSAEYPVCNDTFGSTCLQCENDSQCAESEVCNSEGSCIDRDDPPIAVDDDFTTPEDVAVLMNVLANDIETDGQDMHISEFTQPASGTVTLENNQLLYTPPANFHGAVTFTYTVCDTSAMCAEANVRVVVTPVNDAPVAQDDTAVAAYNQSVVIAVALNDSDVDGDALVVTAITEEPSHGQVVLGQDNQVTYTPEAGFVGLDSFVYSICDPEGLCDTATVTVDVGSTNGAPVLVDDAATTDYLTPVTIDVLANDSDPDGEVLTLSQVGLTPDGTVSIEEGQVVFTPNAGFSGETRFTYTACDERGLCSTANVTVTVGAKPNEPPVALDDVASGLVDSVLVIPVLANDSDPDGDTLTVASFTQPSHGSVVLNEDGSFTYTPEAGYVGEDQFTVTISDGRGGSDTSDVFITLEPIPNQAPLAVDDNWVVDGDRPSTLSVLANDSDPDGDSLTVISVTQPDHGTVALVDGQVVYTPEPGYEGSATFSYTISDGRGGTAEATVTVTYGDRDGDGIGDSTEVQIGTDPDVPDTDGDGINDGDEVDQGTNPLVPDIATPEDWAAFGSGSCASSSGVGMLGLALALGWMGLRRRR